MITQEEYIKAQFLMQRYEAQENKDVILWVCEVDLFSKDNKNIKVFTAGRFYTQIIQDINSSIDDNGDVHHFGPWIIHFTELKKVKESRIIEKLKPL